MKIKKTIPDWLIGLAVTLLFLFITFTGIFDFTDAIEMKSFDLRARLAASQERNPDIELVVISDEDLAELGRFPWPRNILAQGIRNLSKAGARVIALNIFFSEPEESAGLNTIKELKENFDSLGLAQKGPGLSFYKRLSQAEKDLDNDAKLYKSIKDAGNVVLPIYFDTMSRGRDKEAPAFMGRHSFKRIKGMNDELAISSTLWLSKIIPLLPSFAEAAAGIGHNNLFPDKDGYIRQQIHALGYLKDIFFPSYPIAIAKTFKGLVDEDISLSLGQDVALKVSPSSVSHIPVTALI
ncbi:MAG: CHASE2 domain-containing protein, partial [Deltaproteobacteria bacterium]|nr:CHASE2 domain-containing protein [Deltaproteobacteria bacterium]